MNTMINNVKDRAFGTGRTFYLASLGVAATVEGKFRGSFDSLVEKGRGVSDTKTESTTAKTREVVSDRVKDLSDKVGDTVQGGVVATLARLGIPSREEIHALTASVEQLTSKVESMQVKEA